MRILEEKDNKSNIWMRRISKLIGVSRMCVLKSAIGFIIKPDKKIQTYIRLKNAYKKSNLTYKDQWKKIFFKLWKSSNQESSIEMIEHFFLDEMKKLKSGECEGKDNLCVVCCVKNDLIRIKAFVEHYQKIGIDNFIFIDNDSDDGTLDYLLSIENATVYSTIVKYNSKAKTAWINRAVAENGLNRWYLFVDSDEFFMYPEEDKISIEEYVRELEKRNIYVVKAFMLELYPKGNLFSDDYNEYDFRAVYKYFDGDSDDYWYDNYLGNYGGGMHERVFDTGTTTRTKRPLVFCTDSRFEIGSHNIFPLKEDILSHMGAILLHYKFLKGDSEKIRKIVENGNYANGSRLYKKYEKVLDAGNYSAFFERSFEWTGTESFEHLPFIKDVYENVKN